MRTKQLPIWKDAKKRARRLAKESKYYDWARDVGRLKKALLVDYTPELVARAIPRDAIDLAYKKGRPKEFEDLDVNKIEEKYAITTMTTKTPVRHLVESVVSVAAAVLIFVFSFLYLRANPPIRAEVKPSDAQAVTDHNHSEAESPAEEVSPISPSGLTVPNSWINELANSEGYFEKNGKLYLRIGHNTVWNKLWRGRFKFYPSWDETLEKVMEYNPGKRLDRLSPNTELVVIDDLHGSNYLDVLENSLRK